MACRWGSCGDDGTFKPRPCWLWGEGSHKLHWWTTSEFFAEKSFTAGIPHMFWHPVDLTIQTWNRRSGALRDALTLQGSCNSLHQFCRINVIHDLVGLRLVAWHILEFFPTTNWNYRIAYGTGFCTCVKTGITKYCSCGTVVLSVSSAGW